MDSWVNSVYCDGKWCLPKNAYHVIYNVCYISILTYRFFNFRSVDFGLQYVNLLEIQQMQVE